MGVMLVLVPCMMVWVAMSKQRESPHGRDEECGPGHAQHEGHQVRGGDQDSGWGGLAPHGRPPDEGEHSLNVHRVIFSDGDFVKFAKNGQDICVRKKTTSGQSMLSR